MRTNGPLALIFHTIFVVFMGPCQGRLCGLTVTELMAQARGRSPQEIGYYRLRAPVKPITLAELAAVPKTDADVQAVVRG